LLQSCDVNVLSAIVALFYLEGKRLAGILPRDMSVVNPWNIWQVLVYSSAFVLPSVVFLLFLTDNDELLQLFDVRISY